jgi:glycosyltransferase involved in cell wall biosynthesis
MKLAFISDFYHPSIGGTQMLCKGVAEWFMKKGHEIEVLTSPDTNRSELGYKVNEIFQMDFRKNNIIEQSDYDAVFIFADLFSTPLLTCQIDKIKKSVLILNLDENVYRWIKEGRITDLRSRIKRIKEFSHVVSFCKDAPVNKFLEEHDIEYSHIPNFSWDVLNGDSEGKITKETLNINKKIIFNHGRWHPRKNQISLIRAFASSKIKDQYCLVLLGSCENNEEKSHLIECNKFIEKNNLKEHIRLIKGTNNKGIINQLLKISDVYFMPSLSEGLPLVLLEAMSAGLPWVSTPCGGVPGVFGNLGGGKVLQSFNIDSKILEDSINEVSEKNSRQDWENFFSTDKVCNKYLDLLGEIK